MYEKIWRRIYGSNQSNERKIKTNLFKKYDTEYANQSEIVKEKIKNTFNENKDEKLKNIKEKQIKTYLKNYGVEHHMKLKEHIKIYQKIGKEKSWNTIQKYKNYIIPLFNKEELEKFNSNKTYKWKCVKCGNEFEDHIHKTMHIEEFPYLPRCLTCFPYMSGFSKEEKELLNYIKEIYKGEILENDKK